MRASGLIWIATATLLSLVPPAAAQKAAPAAAPCTDQPTRACLIAEALAATAGIDPDDGWSLNHARGEIARNLAEGGLLDEALTLAALEVALGIDDPGWRASGLGALARAQARAGLAAEALATADLIADPTRRGVALHEIVQIHMDAGELDAALVAARAIDGGAVGWRAFALTRIAAAQGLPDVLAEAIAAAAATVDPGWRNRAYLSLWEIQDDPAHLAAAVAAQGAIAEPFEADIALADIARAQARAGRLDAALAGLVALVPE